MYLRSKIKRFLPAEFSETKRGFITFVGALTSLVLPILSISLTESSTSFSFLSEDLFFRSELFLASQRKEFSIMCKTDSFAIKVVSQ